LGNGIEVGFGFISASDTGEFPAWMLGILNTACGSRRVILKGTFGSYSQLDL
jgi:hypothetical protein